MSPIVSQGTGSSSNSNMLSGVLLFQILGPGLSTYIRPLLYPKDQAQFLVLTNLLLKHRPAVLFWATACGLGRVFLIVAARKDSTQSHCKQTIHLSICFSGKRSGTVYQ